MTTGLYTFVVCCAVLPASSQEEGDHVVLLQTSSAFRLGEEATVRAAYAKPLSIYDWRAPAECGQDHEQDLYRPVKEVLSEHPGVDGHCYFSFAAFWINAFPTDPALLKQYDFVQVGKYGVQNLEHLPLTCGFGGIEAHRGKGASHTYKGDWGTVTSLRQDCGFYTQDDIYCYTLGWLKGQHLDSSKLSNATAWLEMGKEECDLLQRKYNFTEEETTIGYCVDQNSGPMMMHVLGGTATSRELARHVYPKCLMSGAIAGACEMAYCQALGCVLPGNKIGHGEECE